MPFLLVTGHPSSGKSTVVQRIVEYFENKGKEVVVIKDDDYKLFHRSDYNDSIKEKEQRSFIRSSVQKHLNKDTVVVCDALNYIKGYRYELFLIGKLCKTTYAVLQCNADESVCKWLNLQKNSNLRYNEEKINELIMRYEKPDANNRWDSPLFELKIGKAERALNGDIPDDMNYDLEYSSPRYVDIPFHDIFTWLCEGVALTENQSTQVVPLAPTNFLHELDRTTQDVIATVLEGQRMTVIGQSIVVPIAEKNGNKVILNRIRSLPELTRLRRQFISFSKLHPVENRAKIASLFINFLNTNK
uniref:Protein KTI12 homolog n=1 Tax=Heterorhabditis bacteriophora TaxID=37862 RepID=A0A1I7WMV2_HETBA